LNSQSPANGRNDDMQIRTGSPMLKKTTNVSPRVQWPQTKFHAGGPILDE
jgi:hypothetical protein